LVLVHQNRYVSSISDALTESIQHTETCTDQSCDQYAFVLRQNGFKSLDLQPRCVFLERSGIPIHKHLIKHFIFDYWELHCNEAGINIPKTTRNKWKDIYYTESTTQKSNWLQYGSRYGRETVQVVHLTTILARTGLFSVSGLLVVCQEEYDIDKVVVTDRHSALWGLVTWEGNRRFVPRNIDNWAIRYIKEVFRKHVHNSIKRKIHTKQLHFLL
uniref:Uncharacterized protein n=1 Tax=Magallana gigas TaxID=29159 RepID=A0A8W8KXE0_MAGGI